MTKRSLSNYIYDRIMSYIVRIENKWMMGMRRKGQLLYLSELIPHFAGKKIFGFANGGSVSNLKGVERLKGYNLITVHDGPFHFYDKYGFMPNMWYLHYGPSAQVVMDHEKKKRLDFSDTFVLVPANDSQSVVFFGSSVVRKFMKAHPEATYVLYREIRSSEIAEYIPEEYLKLGVEPLRSLGISSLHSIFLSISSFLGTSAIYFSGVDNLPTGHFYDRDRPYQSIDGKKLLDFPDRERTLALDVKVRRLCVEHGIDVFRLEKEETLFMSHVFKDFEEALEEASPKIRPRDIVSSGGI
ncbi:hypothetical protein ACFL5E_00095 [Candidatus Omnitrophota bacterium]